MEYDVVIVGSGIAGCVMAKTLTQAGKNVLLLEAGLQAGINLDKNGNFLNYMDYLETFYKADIKVPNSPYPNLPDARSVDVSDIVVPLSPSTGPTTKGYLVQAGPLAFASDCYRGPGGTTLHWLGSTPRLLPNDLKMKTLYGVGVDWPFDYEVLRPFYEMAELEIGVAGSVADQSGPDVKKDINYSKGYVFPMEMIPKSYLDFTFQDMVDKNVNPVSINGKQYDITFVPTPQGRNSIPNKDYPYRDIKWDDEKKKLVFTKDEYWDSNKNKFLPADPDSKYEYLPVGANWDPNTGQRCEGNASCVPICPVQAKYNALKTLRKADQSKLHIQSQSVVSEVLIDDAGNVTGLKYKTYPSADASKKYDTKIAKGKIYVLAASAFENAKILLASPVVTVNNVPQISPITSNPYTVGNYSDQVGRNIMDHLCLLTWGLLPKKGYPYRGPGATSNMPTFRDGDFRKEHAAWICPVDNWGWAWPVFSPGSDLANALAGKMFGKALRDYLTDVLPRQLLLHYECEQIPEPENRLTINPAYKDVIDNYRPVINYDASDYMRKAFETATELNKQTFDRAGITNKTVYKPTTADYVTYNGVGYNFAGAGHIVGTHRMGKTREDSVVNEHSQAWGHENLFLIGCGNMPTLGTSNPTLTMTALTFKAADAILKVLEGIPLK